MRATVDERVKGFGARGRCWRGGLCNHQPDPLDLRLWLAASIPWRYPGAGVGEAGAAQLGRSGDR